MNSSFSIVTPKWLQPTLLAGVILPLLLLLAACGDNPPTPPAQNTVIAASPTAFTPPVSPTVAVPPTKTIAPTPTTSSVASGPVKAKIGSEFKLKLKQVALIEPENLEVQFLEIREDSRCPVNVNCAWSGQLVIEVAVSRNKQPLGKYLLNSIEAYRNKDKPTFEKYNLALVKAEPGRVYENYGSSNSQIKPPPAEELTVSLAMNLVTPAIAPTIQSSLDQRSPLKYGQIAEFAAEGLSLKFDGLSEESRCPNSQYVACSHAGTATIRVLATKGKITTTLSLTIPGLTDDTTTKGSGKSLDSARATFEGYRVQLVSLEPQPDATTGKTALSAYTTTLLVIKI